MSIEACHACWISCVVMFDSVTEIAASGLHGVVTHEAVGSVLQNVALVGVGTDKVRKTHDQLFWHQQHGIAPALTRKIRGWPRLTASSGCKRVMLERRFGRPGRL